MATQERPREGGSGPRAVADGPAPDPNRYHGLDELLTEAAAGGPSQRWWPGLAGVKLAGRLATRPRAVTRRTAGFAF